MGLVLVQVRLGEELVVVKVFVKVLQIVVAIFIEIVVVVVIVVQVELVQIAFQLAEVEQREHVLAGQRGRRLSFADGLGQLSVAVFVSQRSDLF